VLAVLPREATGPIRYRNSYIVERREPKFLAAGIPIIGPKISRLIGNIAVASIGVNNPATFQTRIR